MQTTQQRREARQQKNYLTNQSSSAKTDEEKYRAASNSVLSRGENLDRNALKKAIDQEYSALNPTKSGREMRGENAWSDFVEGINNVRHGINTGIGNGIDWLWDNTAGNLAGAIGGKESEKAVKDFMTGEDLSIIPDIASDVLLTIPGWTIPLVVAKEAFRNADNMNEALTGKDSITLEQLDDDQRGAKAAMSALGIGLSAIPGIGKAKSIAKLVKDSSAAAKKTAAETSKALDAAKEAAKTDKPKYEKVLEQYQKDLDEYQKLQNPEVLFKLSSPGSKMTPEAEAGLKKAVTQPTEPVKPEAVTKLENAAAANTAAQQEASKSTADRVKGLFNEDVSGFVQALKNIPETWKASRGRIGAEKQLKSAMRKANAGADEEVGKLTKKSTAEERRKALEAAMPEIKTAEGELDKDAMSTALDDLLEKAGYSLKDETGRFKPGLPNIMPQFIRSAGDVAQDIGLQSNRSLINSMLETEWKTQGDIVKALELTKNGNDLEKALARIGLNAKQNPTGAASTFKSTLLGPVTSMPLIPLAYQAEYGGDYADNMKRIADDIEKNGVGRYLAATFPVGGQRMLAQSALPGLTGRLGAYHPYGAIRAASTIGDANEYAEVPAMQRRFEEALKNNSKKAGK